MLGVGRPAMTTNNVFPTLSQSDAELRQRFKSLSTAQDVALLLEIPYARLNHLLYGSPGAYQYRTFHIPKKAGGLRTISVPPNSILILQSKLLRVLKLVHKSKIPSHGVSKDTSILTNARLHIQKDYVLNLDLVDFFPSINFGRVRGMFMASPHNIPSRAAAVLAQICCYERRLPQGAPTSPILSDMVCARLDGQMIAFAKRFHCIYSRYLDDITISRNGSRFPRQVASFDFVDGGTEVNIGGGLRQVVESNGFEINQDKVRMQTKGHHQEVTGLVVNSFPNVHRTYIRRVRAMIHDLEHNGEYVAFRKMKTRRVRKPSSTTPDFGQVMLGKLELIKMVKGETDPVYRKLRKELHSVRPLLIDDLPDLPDLPQDETTPPLDIWRALFSEQQSIVLLLEAKKDGDTHPGTAFIVSDSIVATAAHNIVGEIIIYYGDEAIEVPHSAITLHPRFDGINTMPDVALLSLPSVISPKPVKIRPQTGQAGEHVVALGYPVIPQRQPAIAIRDGIIQAVPLSYDGLDFSLTVSCATSGGMSGGPVFDRHGAVVGIVMEETFNQPADGLPGLVERHVAPVRYLREVLSTIES